MQKNYSNNCRSLPVKQKNGSWIRTPAARFHYPTSPLTNRELEVLMLIRKGLSNKQIAEQLFLAESTIKFHITSLLSKLLAGNRTEAINNAIQRGILSN